MSKQLLTMAAIAPCAHYGCGCGHFDHLRNCHSSGTMQQGASMILRMQRLLLEHRPFKQKQWEANQLVKHCPTHQVGPFVKAILDQPVPLRWMHTLSLQTLGALLRLHPAIVATQFCNVKNNIAWLFPDDGDVDGAGAFLHSLLWHKEAMGQSALNEASQFTTLLRKQAQQKDLRKVPASSARAWLLQIWKDVTSARPNRDLLVGCCVRWIAEPHELSAVKATALEILKQEACGKRAPDVEVWIISLIFQEVSLQPHSHSPDLQQLLWLLPSPPTPATVRSLLYGLSNDGRSLMSLWSCVCNWTPQKPSARAFPWCFQGPALYFLLRSMLGAFSQLPDSKMLCQSALMSLAASGTTQHTSLLLAFYKEGPVLPADVWMPLLPHLMHLAIRSPQAAELGSRLRALGNGNFSTAHHMAQAKKTNASAQGPMSTASSMQAHAGKTVPSGPFQSAQTMQTGRQGPAFSQPWPQQRQQGNQLKPAQSQRAQHGPMQPLPTVPTGTQFVPLAPHQSKAVPHKPPSVGLHNINNTCYMNSFVQGLFSTDAFLWRIYTFNLKLKNNPCRMDKEDYEFGKKVVELLKKQFAKMALTRHQHTDLWDILQEFPENYRSGEHQDVTETIRFVFDKLGGSDQELLKEVFGGRLREMTQCKGCGSVRIQEESFTDIVVPVPTAKEVNETGRVPTIQELLDERLKFEELDAECLVTCESCRRKTQVCRWSEIASPPAHLCLCLNRFGFDMEKSNFTKEKTPVQIDKGLWIGGYEYELYHAIIHSGKGASSGHYYAIGRRSEPTPSGDPHWYTMDDSQIRPAEMSLLAGNPPENLVDDNAYVLFLRCKQAARTPQFRVPFPLVDYVKKEDEKHTQWFHRLHSFIMSHL